MSQNIDPNIKKEVERRRTFGIISHPDAGKTTLTEKLLLYGGAIQMAGTVKSRKAAAMPHRLDGNGAGAWYFRYHLGHEIQLQ